MYSSLQVKFGLSYILIIAAVLLLLNTYPLRVSQDLVFRSKEATLESSVSVMVYSLSDLDHLTEENVAQAMDGIDEEKVRYCLDQAGLTEKITSLPAGIKTHVGRDVYLDGVEFSGGQTQRLMLARALYKDAPILVLDEPTAALDPIAEDDIYQKYNEMTRGRTSLFISHRLASTRFCDRILFLENGRVVEEGTHDQLMAQNGGYAKLFAVQSKYYKEGKAV